MNRAVACLTGLLLTLTLCLAVPVSASESPAAENAEKKQTDPKPEPARERPPLTNDQIDEALGILERIDTDAAQAFQKQREEDPQAVGKALRRWFPRMEHFLALRRYDPKMYELRVEDFRLAHASRKLARQLVAAREAKDAEQVEAYTAKLQSLVESHFDLRQRMREHELARLESRIERLREKLKERAADRGPLIDQRLMELTEGGEETQW